MKKLYPVIHFKNIDQTLENAELVFKYDCSGLFLIDMHGGRLDGFNKAIDYLLQYWQGKDIGTNRCMDSIVALTLDRHQSVCMAWDDDPGIHTDETIANPIRVKHVNKALEKIWIKNPTFNYFGSIAFKTQFPDFNPGAAALEAISHGWIPTTSGTATGIAAEIKKIEKIKEAIGDNSLAIASGITPDNVDEFLPYIDYFLVATGISKDFHQFDEAKLAKLSEKIHRCNN